MKSREEQIAELLVQWEDAREQGRPVSVEELCRNQPELQQALIKAIDSVNRMQWMVESARPSQEQPSIQTLSMGTRLSDRYRVDELIGIGGFGKVYRGFDEKLQRAVAIKISRPDRNHHNRSLFDEARKAAKLRHPNLVTIHDVAIDEANAFIVSDLIDGPPLSNAGHLTIERVVEVMAQIADAVDFAHRSGVIHCDIKPENILLCADGRPVLADFCIARFTHEDASKIVGTAAYMAPELLAQEDSTPTELSDVWSLGVVLHQLLYGRLPGEQIVQAKGMTRASTIQQNDPQPPKELSQIVAKCLATNPQDRMQSARLLADQLRSFSQASNHPHDETNRIPWPVVLLPILLVAGAFATWYSRSMFTTGADKQSTVEGMYFDGETKLVTPLVRFAPCTIEAWVRPATDDATCGFIGSDSPGEYGLVLGAHQGLLYVESLSRSSQPIAPIRSNRWTHIAACYDEHETRLFADGRIVFRDKPTHIFGDMAFAIGALSPIDSKYQMQGHVRSVRISSGSRYESDFEPPKELKADSQCKLLYDLTLKPQSPTGQKVIVYDLSSNKNNGTIVRTIKHSPEPPQKPFTFRFIGGTAIATEVERFAPSTLEAWINPFGYSNSCNFIIGSDIQSKYGLGLAICGGHLAAEYMNGMLVSKTFVPCYEWSHVAVVFGESETTLFFNGAKVETGPATMRSGGERFVIGRLAESVIKDEFFGQVRCLRISKGKRYSIDFLPSRTFETDSETLLIYQGDYVAGTKVLDLSGNGNDGLFISANPVQKK